MWCKYDMGVYRKVYQNNIINVLYSFGGQVRVFGATQAADGVLFYAM